MTSVRERLIRGVGAGVFNQIVSAAIQILAIRIFVSAWGQDRNGEWLMLSAIVSGVAMSDIGIAMAAGNSMTTHMGAGAVHKARKVFADGWWMLTVFSGLFGLCLTSLVFLTPFLDWLDFRTSSKPTYQLTILLLVAQTLVALQTSMYLACLRASGHYSRSINISTIARVFEFGLQCLAIVYLGSLEAVAAAGLIARFVEYIGTSMIRRRYAAWSKASWQEIDFGCNIALLRPAASSVAFPLGQMLGNQGILYVIYRVLGPGAVTIFVAHRTLANIAFQMVQTISHSVLPEFSLAFGAGNLPLAMKLHRKAFQISLVAGLIGCLLVALLAKPILSVWTAGQIEYESLLMISLLVWVGIRSIWYTSLFVAMSINRHHRIATCFVIGTTAALLLAFPMVRCAGVAGAAGASVIAELFFTLVVIQTSLRLVEDSLSSFLRNVFGYAR